MRASTQSRGTGAEATGQRAKNWQSVIAILALLMSLASTLIAWQLNKIARHSNEIAEESTLASALDAASSRATVSMQRLADAIQSGRIDARSEWIPVAYKHYQDGMDAALIRDDGALESFEQFTEIVRTECPWPLEGCPFMVDPSLLGRPSECRDAHGPRSSHARLVGRDVNCGGRLKRGLECGGTHVRNVRRRLYQRFSTRE